MRVIFTKHARERMRERNISEKEVRQAIYSPDKKEPWEINKDKYSKKVKRQNIITKEIFVILKREKGKIIVITAY